MGLSPSTPKLVEVDCLLESPPSSGNDGRDDGSSSDEKYIYLPHPQDRPPQPGDEFRQNVIQWHDKVEAASSKAPERLVKFAPVDSLKKPLPHIWRLSDPSKSSSSQNFASIGLVESSTSLTRNVASPVVMMECPAEKPVPVVETPINEATGVLSYLKRHSNQNGRIQRHIAQDTATENALMEYGRQNNDGMREVQNPTQHRLKLRRQAYVAMRRADKPEPERRVATCIAVMSEGRTRLPSSRIPDHERPG